MKKLLLLLTLIVPMIISCNSSNNQKSDEEIIAEQINLIDSLLSTNAPVTTNSFKVGDLKELRLSAREMIYKGDTVPYLLIYATVRNWGGYGNDQGVAIVTPKEIMEICSNIDSISKKTTLKIENTQTVSYSSKGGLTINADNSWGAVDSIHPWSVTIIPNYQGKAEVSINPKELSLLKNLLMNSYVETDGYKHLDKLSLKNPEIRKNNKFY